MSDVFYDPPSGWKYGFPKKLPEGWGSWDDKQFEEWLVKEGYPKEDLELAMKYGRYMI